MRVAHTILVAASLLAVPALSLGQADSPAPVTNAMPANDFGFNLPRHLGTLSYSLTANEILETGFGNVSATTGLSGNLAYLSKNEKDPFSMIYSGGVLFTSIPGEGTVQTFQNIAASQVLNTGRWDFVISDAFSFLPSAPTSGLSGIAGVGDVGVTPVQVDLGPTQGILTSYSTQITNGLQGSASWEASPSLSLGASGSYQILHFTGGNSGLDTDGVTGTFGPTYRIDARNSVGASAFYSRWTYPNYQDLSLESEGATVNYTRAWTRRLSTSISLGPQRTHGRTFSYIANQPIQTIPGRWDIGGSASATYSTRTTGFAASYTRAVNGGSGILAGTLTDTAVLSMTRPIDRDWSMAYQFGYNHNVALAPVGGFTPQYDSIYAAAQVSRRLTDTLSAYASYSPIWQNDQNVPNSPVTNAAFRGLNNIFSIGITFAPAPIISSR